MKEIAVYGKGGIGKSTISANLSAALSLAGQRVLQIGCDPKHDSTRLLTHGQKLVTVLDYIRVTNPLEYRLEDVLINGYGGVGCVEAGGPEPGVGCAGRGIISTFDFLNQFKLKEHYDITLYDVLGDVVCGGFAVPIRREYADSIFVVTSGEFMSLYAANNILRGIRNYDDQEKRVAGILYNQRNIENEDDRVALFAQAVDLPIVSRIPRSDTFTRAERAEMTVVEKATCGPVRETFIRLAGKIKDGCDHYEAKPLSDEQLEETVFGRIKNSFVSTAKDVASEKKTDAIPGEIKIDLTDPNRCISKNIIHNEPFFGCAFNGAMRKSVHLHDAVILAHSPKSCSYISYQSISSAGRRGLFERGVLLPASISPDFKSSEMTETDMIFGGMDKLIEKIIEIKKQKPKAIVVISACPAGIIGDDINRVKQLSEPDMPIITVKTDGNMSGDFLQGTLMCYTSLAKQIINRDVPILPDTVNIIAEKDIAKTTYANYKMIEELLSRIGVKINCRFLYETSFDKLRNFCSAPLNLLANGEYTGMVLKDFFTREYGSTFLDMAFPVGFAETGEWLLKTAAFFGRQETAEAVIAENTERYKHEAEALKPELEGKRLMVLTQNHELDWILQTAIDVGMEIVKVGILKDSQDEGFRTRLRVSYPLEEDYNRDNREKDLEQYRPDVLLTNYTSSMAHKVSVADTIPMFPDVGFYSGLLLAKRWAKLFKLNIKGEWRQDERLFKEYYAG